MAPAPDRDHNLFAMELAATQFGVVTRSQLRAQGMSCHQIRNLTGPHGRWVPLSDEVLRLVGAPVTAEQRTMAAVLDAGPDARLSCASAGRWWGLQGCRLEPTVVSRTSGSRRGSSLASIRRVRFLPERWTTVHRGVPTVRPELLAMQLFAVCSYGRAERLTERLWSMRLFSGASLGSFIEDIPLRGVRGSAHLRRYFDARGGDYRPPDSGLESRFDQITRDAGLSFRRQVDTGAEDHWTGRVDFLHEHLPLVVEIQSEAHHSSLVDREADAARIAALRSAGFTVVEITDTTVWTDPSGTIDAVRHGLEVCCGMRHA